MNSRSIINTLIYQIRFQARQEIKDYYFAECLRVVAENTAHLVNLQSYGEVQGSIISKSLSDMFKPADTRTAEDIINEVIEKGGLKVV